jgi:hypothetical protein
VRGPGSCTPQEVVIDEYGVNGGVIIRRVKLKKLEENPV